MLGLCLRFTSSPTRPQRFAGQCRVMYVRKPCVGFLSCTWAINLSSPHSIAAAYSTCQRAPTMSSGLGTLGARVLVESA